VIPLRVLALALLWALIAWLSLLLIVAAAIRWA
jgi:hypothetical protein